ncbi:MAG TPA: membrane protein insertion efficiency factor YidD [Candidatus Binatia bacterium]
MGKRIFILVVSGYRAFLSPLLPRSCRFFPSCSAYAEEAIARRGFGTGLWLTARRLLRCRPGHPGGYDPVP